MCKTQASQGVIEAEALWTQFVAKHNISFQTSDHATKLISRMLHSKEICLWTHKNGSNHQGSFAPPPHFLSKTLNDVSKFFSIMIDESSDKTDKSCIILVHVFYSCVGDIHTRFLDMPIVNVGTACNLLMS